MNRLISGLIFIHLLASKVLSERAPEELSTRFGIAQRDATTGSFCPNAFNQNCDFNQYNGTQIFYNDPFAGHRQEGYVETKAPFTWYFVAADGAHVGTQSRDRTPGGDSEGVAAYLYGKFCTVGRMYYLVDGVTYNISWFQGDGSSPSNPPNGPYAAEFSVYLTPHNSAQPEPKWYSSQDYPSSYSILQYQSGMRSGDRFTQKFFTYTPTSSGDFDLVFLQTQDYYYGQIALTLITVYTNVMITTSAMTTQDITTSSLTSSEMTTSEFTSFPLTSSAISTSRLTTLDITTSPMSTSKMTSSELTSAELTSSELTSLGITTASISTSALTSLGITSSAISTSPLTTSPITAYECSLQGFVSAIAARDAIRIRTIACPTPTTIYLAENTYIYTAIIISAPNLTIASDSFIIYTYNTDGIEFQDLTLSAKVVCGDKLTLTRCRYIDYNGTETDSGIFVNGGSLMLYQSSIYCRQPFQFGCLGIMRGTISCLDSSVFASNGSQLIQFAQSGTLESEQCTFISLENNRSAFGISLYTNIIANGSIFVGNWITGTTSSFIGEFNIFTDLNPGFGGVNNQYSVPASSLGDFSSLKSFKSFELYNTSSAINAFCSTPSSPVDQNGNDRTQNVYSDIGSFESSYVPSVYFTETTFVVPPRAATLNVTVTISSLACSASITVKTVDSNAQSGREYVQSQKTFNFDPTNLSGVFSVNILDSPGFTEDRKFTIEFQSPSGVYGHGSVEVTIQPSKITSVTSASITYPPFTSSSITTSRSNGNSTTTGTSTGSPNIGSSTGRVTDSTGVTTTTTGVTYTFNRTVSLITINLEYDSIESINKTALVESILKVLGLSSSESYRIVFVLKNAMKRDVDVLFFIDGDSKGSSDDVSVLTAKFVNTVSADHSAMPGFKVTKSPVVSNETVQESSTGPVTSSSTTIISPDISDRSGSFSKSLKIGLIVAAAVIFATALIAVGVYVGYSRYKKRNGSGNFESEAVELREDIDI